MVLPAGRVEPGETLADGALRETLEETGVPVRLTGIYRVEHSPAAGSARVRVIYAAEPVDDTPPKSTPDDESLEARWVALGDLDDLPGGLRGAGVKRLLREVNAGVTAYPLSLIDWEGSSLL